MTPQLLQQANYVLDSCGRQVPPPNTSWVDIPAHKLYTRYQDGTSPGSEDIGGVQHEGRVSFMLRAMTAQSLPRETQGVFWRLRFPSGRYFQSEMAPHACAFGFGSDRQVFLPEIEWKPGEKIYVDLDTIIGGPPPSAGLSTSIMFEGVYRFPITGRGAVTNPLVLDMPRYFQNATQNIMAPEFKFGPGCPSETPAGYRDEEFCYVTPTANLLCGAPGPPTSNVMMQVEQNSDFIIRQIWPYVPTTTGFGSVVVRMRRGDGYALSSNFLPINSIQGPMFRDLKIKAGDSFYWDAYVVDGGGGAGATITFGLYLYGVKRRKVLTQ